MITVLSPAKKLSAECSSKGSAHTKPTFLDDSDEGHQSSESSRPPFRANSGNSCSRWTGGTSVEKSEIRNLAKP